MPTSDCLIFFSCSKTKSFSSKSLRHKFSPGETALLFPPIYPKPKLYHLFLPFLAQYVSYPFLLLKLYAMYVNTF